MVATHSKPGPKWSSIPLIDRISAKVVKLESGCWVWTGARTAAGYGEISFEGRPVFTHIKVYEHHFGQVPDGMLVRHSCDNPPCVRPDHLLLGTHLQNMEDMRQRDRSAHGERNHVTPLTADVVRRIFLAYHAGAQVEVIAEENATTIW